MTSSSLHLSVTLLLIAVASRHVVLGGGKSADSESTGSSSTGAEILAGRISDGDDAKTTSDGEPEAVLKRKWGPVSLQAWGKRKWGATNSMAAWGKRDMAAEQGRKQDELAESAAEEILSAMAADRQVEKRKWGRSELAAWGKRKWGANNNMKAWGKRAVIDQLDDNEAGGIVDGLQHESADQARSRRSVSFDDVNSDEMQSLAAAAAAASGAGHPRRLVGGGRKRQYRRTGSTGSYGYGGPKRTWDMNTMKAWGKRHSETVADVPAAYKDDDEEALRPGSKRAWASDNSLRIWG